MAEHEQAAAKKAETPVTMGDVARAAGVSKPVVSAILRSSEKNHSRFSVETMRRVLKAVKELNYRPSRTARKFIGRRKSCIGLAARRVGMIRPQILTFLTHWAALHDLEILLEQIPEHEPPRFLTEDMVDGIIAFHRLSPELVRELERHDIPLVYLNTDGAGRKARHIRFDEADGIRQILDHFHTRGRRRCLFFAPQRSPTPLGSHRQRIDALREHAAAIGMAEPAVFNPMTSLPLHAGAELTALVHEALDTHPSTDCLIVDWDHDALCVYEAARQRGLRIPDELSVVSISTERNMICTRVHPQLSNLHLNNMEIGRLTILAMLDRFTGRRVRQKDITIRYRLDVRES